MHLPRLRNRGGAVTLGLLALALAASVACQRATDKAAAGTADPSQVVAVVGGKAITVADVEARLQGQSPFARGRYANAEKKKELLEEMVRFEAMAQEAERRGYDKDPEVVRVMRQQMISKFMEKEFDAKHTAADVPDAAVEKYYREHSEEFSKKDEVLVGEIVVKDKTKADKVLVDAKALTPSAGVDQKAFRDMVTRYSEDAASKAQGGVVPFFSADSTAHPKTVVEAAFALRAVGDVSPPVATDEGWVILTLLQKRPGFDRPLVEVRLQIQERLFRDVRAQAFEKFVAELEKKTTVVVHDENLTKVTIVAPSASARTNTASASLPLRP